VHAKIDSVASGRLEPGMIEALIAGERATADCGHREVPAKPG
jgi:hypothetical protein